MRVFEEGKEENLGKEPIYKMKGACNVGTCPYSGKSVTSLWTFPGEAHPIIVSAILSKNKLF